MTAKKQAAAADTSAKANIDPASEFSTSGAPRQVTDVDPNHPAIDNNPRAGTTVDQNRIDMNDPTKDGADAVAEQLGMKTAAEAEADAADAAEAKRQPKTAE